MLRLFTRGHPKAVEKWNAPIHALNKGVVIPSEDVAVEQNSDGRVRLTLTPLGRAKVAGGHGGPYAGNMLVIS